MPALRLTLINSVLVSALALGACALSQPAAAQELIISGVIDGPRTGGTPKAIELYVAQDVSDLSRFGISSANNGNGATGAPEFTLPAGSASAGTYLYVASEDSEFTAFFGFAPDYQTSAALVNGDDAIELFRDGVVVDVFGDVNVDGSGQPWEYLDGWTYRVDNTGPDGSVFGLGNWTFSGPNALDGESDNATAAVPFPIATFTTAGNAGDSAPRVVATTPANGSTGVAADSDLQIVFSEPVLVDGAWVDLSCDITGIVALTPSTVDNVTFDIAVVDDLAAGENCTLAILSPNVRDIDADDPPDTMVEDVFVSFSIAEAGVTGVVINEILADPASDLDGDANGDGTRDGSEDEFVEIVNVTGGSLDVSGWVINDGFGLRHEFAAGTVIADGCAIVVFGGGVPTGGFGGALVQTASTGFLGFNNGGDTVEIRTAGGALVATEGYGSEGGSNQSLTRSPDITGAFVQHLGVADTPFSPGTRVAGEAFAGCDAPSRNVTVAEIQGAGSASPLVGETVVVSGIVTGDAQDADADTQTTLRGFYLQSLTPDSDPATSEGVFVFDGTGPATDVVVGDLVTVTGTVVEFFGETQVSASGVSIDGSGTVPAPAMIELPVPAILGEDGEYIPDLEAYEGMLVSFPQDLTVTDTFNLDRFGQLHLVFGPQPFQFTNRNAPDVAGFDAFLEDLGGRSIMLDDGLTVQNPDPVRYPAPGQPGPVDVVVRSGDTVSGLVGNVRYSRGSGGSGGAFYRIIPTAEPTFAQANPRPPVPSVGGEITVATVNVLNFFTTLDVGDAVCGPSLIGCRGADSQAEFDRQLPKLVGQLLEIDADVLALVELENNAVLSLSVLADALNTQLGTSQYDFIDTGTIGGDAIKVGFLYDTTAVMPRGPAAVLDNSVDARFIDDRNRPVLAQTFESIASAGVLTIAVNHLKSKGSPCADIGDPNANDGQGNCNGTRALAAQATIDWLATDPTGAGDSDVMVIGDFNAYLLEDPIQAYRDAGYTNLIDWLDPDDAYTLIFDRQVGALDHAIVSPSLVPQVAGVAIWHANTDEADLLDYNLDFGRNPDIFDAALVNRASDHDPVIVGLNLTGDLDGDGVPNADDVCPSTVIPEGVPSVELRRNRWALTDDDTAFDTSGDSRFSFSTADTAGCSCEQIIVEQGLGSSQSKYGCSTRVLFNWQRALQAR